MCTILRNPEGEQGLKSSSRGSLPRRCLGPSGARATTRSEDVCPQTWQNLQTIHF